jgi:hypothetical protein
MAVENNRMCPLSEDFFYWPPEEIAQYRCWCEVVTFFKRDYNKKYHEKNLKKEKISDD